MTRAAELRDPAAGITALIGNGEAEIDRAGALAELDDGMLVFLKSTAPEATLAALKGSDCAAAVVCTPDAAERLRGNRRLAFLVADNPRLSFLRLVSAYFPPQRPPAGVHPLAHVDPTARVDATASVGPFCHVGPGCIVGPDTILHPHVTLYEKVRIGRGAVVHAGAAIGADGFGYERNAEGGLEKFPHIGGVLIEDEVEIGSNTSIDRGSLGDTVLRRGCKIDNQIHIAHNVEVGEDAAVIAQSMIGGSVRIGASAWLAPAAVIMNQVDIGRGALVGLGAVVTKPVADGETVMGAPAAPEAEFKATRAALKALVRGQSN